MSTSFPRRKAIQKNNDQCDHGRRPPAHVNHVHVNHVHVLMKKCQEMLVEGMSDMLTKGQAQVHKPIRKHIALSSGLSQSFDMPLKQVVQGIPVDVWKIC